MVYNKWLELLTKYLEGDVESEFERLLKTQDVRLDKLRSHPLYPDIRYVLHYLKLGAEISPSMMKSLLNIFGESNPIIMRLEREKAEIFNIICGQFVKVNVKPPSYSSNVEPPLNMVTYLTKKDAKRQKKKEAERLEEYKRLEGVAKRLEKKEAERRKKEMTERWEKVVKRCEKVTKRYR